MSMKLKYIGITILLASLMIGAFFLRYTFLQGVPSQDAKSGLFVGVDAAYDSLDEIKTLIDTVSNYTNLFVVGSSGISYNTTKLNEVCQYVYDRDMSFIVYTEDSKYPGALWFENAKSKWGDHFLGFYAFDEVGGRQLDIYEYRPVKLADNYTDASNQFVTTLNMSLKWVTRNYNASLGFNTFSSDYALYWFDYKSGYDVVFSEFGWNYSRQLNVALCRGAATAQNRDWGAIMTWTYTKPPYIESGEKLYNDMVLAYQNGAKYIVVFDTNENYTHGILQDEHLDALKSFWQYAKNSPRTTDMSEGRVAFVLPKDFAYGFRGPKDRIWGLDEATAFSNETCIILNSQLEAYGTKLDVIYDEISDYSQCPYDKITFWNGTMLTP